MAARGAAAAWPLAPRARQAGKSYRVSYLSLVSGEDATLGKPFSQRPREFGYIDGQNTTLDFRSAEGRPERLAALARDIVESDPDVLVAGFGALAAKAAAAATKTIPIVFTNAGDPVGAGLVASLPRPGANMTGLSAQASEVAAKRLEMLEELVPGKRTFAVILNPDTPFSAVALGKVQSAAKQTRQPLAVFEARTADEMTAALHAAIEAAAGLLALEDPKMFDVKQKIADLAAAARLPAIYGVRDFVVAGGLMSYRVDLRQISRRAAELVDKILKGARPADLPVVEPAKFELAINLKAAKALGIEIPPLLLASADEVIE